MSYRSVATFSRRDFASVTMDDLERIEEEPEEPEAAIVEDELEETPVEKSHSLLITILVGVAMLLAGILFGYVGRGEFGPEARASKSTATAQAVAAATQTAANAELSATQAAANADLMTFLTENTRHYKGDPNAPVTIIEFSDFQWPFCGKFANEAGRFINENYVNSGKVRLGYWNMAFLGEESTWAAEAAECAADQDKYWEYHDKLFASQSGENQGAFAKENLKQFAADLGLDSDQFNECMDTGKHTELIQSDTSMAQQIGVQSTPSFLVNGTPLVGAVPVEEFQSLIEQKLTK